MGTLEFGRPEKGSFGGRQVSRYNGFLSAVNGHFWLDMEVGLLGSRVARRRQRLLFVATFDGGDQLFGFP
jgi:hypothetical protein